MVKFVTISGTCDQFDWNQTTHTNTKSNMPMDESNQRKVIQYIYCFEFHQHKYGSVKTATGAVSVDFTCKNSQPSFANTL
jgi:Tfp pilus assembly protein PilV